MHSLLQVSDTEELAGDQRELLANLDGEVCTREMLGVLVHMIQDIDSPSIKNKDFTSRAPQVFSFLREHGIDFFTDIDFSHWDNIQWIGALSYLRKHQHDIDSGMIASVRPNLAFVGKPFVDTDMARQAGTSPNLLSILEDEFPEFDFNTLTLDTRSAIEKVGDFLHITSHSRLTSGHPFYTNFFRNKLVPKVAEVVAHSVAAEGNHMARQWMKICGLRQQGAPLAHMRSRMDIFFRQLRGMQEDRTALFHTVLSAEEHVVSERAMHPGTRAADINGVLGQVTTSLRDAWKRKYEAGDHD